MNTILVTGGAGYIGCHTVRALQKEGFKVVVLDNLIHGHKKIIEKVLKVPLVIGDIADTELIEKILINVKEKLPEFSKKHKLKTRRFHSFLRICYDNLFNDKSTIGSTFEQDAQNFASFTLDAGVDNFIANKLYQLKLYKIYKYYT